MFLSKLFTGLPDKRLYPSVSAVYGNTEVSMVYLGPPLDGWVNIYQNGITKTITIRRKKSYYCQILRHHFTFINGTLRYSEITVEESYVNKPTKTKYYCVTKVKNLPFISKPISYSNSSHTHTSLLFFNVNKELWNELEKLIILKKNSSTSWLKVLVKIFIFSSKSVIVRLHFINLWLDSWVHLITL